MMTAARHWWNRQHRFTRAQLDAENWPHPRPARDPRLVFLHLGLVWSSMAQIIVGPARDSVQARAFDTAAVVAFAILAGVGSVLVLYAAFCRSQYWSFITELSGCGGFVLMFTLYLVAQSSSNSQWWITNVGGWAAGLLIGNALRMYIIGRRFW